MCCWGDPGVFTYVHVHAFIQPKKQGFKGITKWILPSEEEAEDVGGIMEALIKVCGWLIG